MELKKALENIGELQYFLNIINSCDEYCYFDGNIHCYNWQGKQFYPEEIIIGYKNIVSFVLKGRAVKTPGLKRPMQRYLAWQIINKRKEECTHEK